MECVRLRKEDAEKFREIRLEGLNRHPKYSIASYDKEKDLPLSFFEEKLETQYFYGFYEDDILVGVGGLFRPFREIKKKHIVRMTGVYLKPEYRGRGLAKTLLEQLLEKASEIAEQVVLSVAEENDIAIQLYESFGFEALGVWENSLKIGEDDYIDDVLMIKFLDKP